MYVCLCHGITDGHIREAISEGCCSFRDVRSTLGVGTQCGKCACAAKGLVKETLSNLPIIQTESPMVVCPANAQMESVALEAS
ncbi:bacterioferritin-associated ferredoxin [Azomonas macrocytogenes]|uniref:Bacterioferritin-associated ferredoxin n=1 Tax=Azomonas macrocytogenes TaxID=69962 RepID=A0A839T0G5_AZOMA|nr:bacterioferritin-associated ferredoxin [Azomonas macrocytogenes]MBB3101996.1 bacterioferritin-associated ferredoxin [Azomonas macrocytogenes]